MDIRTREAIRYLGYGRNDVDEKTFRLIEASFTELEKIIEKRMVFQVFQLHLEQDDSIDIEGMKIFSKNLSKNLKGCERVLVLGATLGIQVDRWMKRYSYTDMAKVLVMQSCAAAMLEEYLDDWQEKQEQEFLKENWYLRPRFSPGYGDFSIEHQKQILEMLQATKKIGLSMTDSSMLTPTKSVTAVIGMSRTKTACHQKGCEVCGKKDCIYRRDT